MEEEFVLEAIKQHALHIYNQDMEPDVHAAHIIAIINSYRDRSVKEKTPAPKKEMDTKTFVGTRRCQGCIRIDSDAIDQKQCVIRSPGWLLCDSPKKEYYGKADKEGS